ncbi:MULTISPECIES: cytochrome c3 family protein [unclassified Adlercreutzia]|uniref:cytochrome c3 family protein n=1 Tax=unclassified Adlercreutzia TaxID=2636013 RepID=UPI0013EA32C0|nr:MULTISPECIES: cytochrome c3 family protein [unclassified Adlercreutzia]
MKDLTKQRRGLRGKAIIACAVAALTAGLCLVACSSGSKTTAVIPDDHIDQASMAVTADHQNCQSCHASLPEQFNMTGDLMQTHMDILSKYDAGETTEETDRIMGEHADEMKQYFSEDTMGNCTNCHTLGVNEAGDFEVDITFKEYCASCHDDYDYVIEQTADWGKGTEMWDWRLSDEQAEGQMTWEEYTSYPINPHLAHGTNVACGDCHKIHQKTDSFYCSQCHIWAMPGDNGEETYTDWAYDQEMYRNWRSDNQFSPNEGKQG